jgi:hypothetical protein
LAFSLGKDETTTQNKIARRAVAPVISVCVICHIREHLIVAFSHMPPLAALSELKQSVLACWPRAVA